MSFFPRLATASDVAAALKAHIIGKNVLITGVSPKSIGTETIRAIAPYAKTVIAASRSTPRCSREENLGNKSVTELFTVSVSCRVKEALQPVLEEHGSANITTIELDLASERSIRDAAAQILQFGIPVDVVINNAATAQYATLTRTKEGFEAQMGVNHLGHFLFNSLILDALRAAVQQNGSARIISVASKASWIDGEIRIDDINYEIRPDEYVKIAAYAKTKTANILYVQEFAKRFKDSGILALSLHPGVIRDTNMGEAVSDEEWKTMGVLKSDGTPVMEGAFKTTPQGASTTIVAAFHPDLATHNGEFLNDNGLDPRGLPSWAKDDVMAEKLWNLSELLWKINFGQNLRSSL